MKIRHLENSEDFRELFTIYLNFSFYSAILDDSRFGGLFISYRIASKSWETSIEVILNTIPKRWLQLEVIWSTNLVFHLYWAILGVYSVISVVNVISVAIIKIKTITGKFVKDNI